MRVWPVEVDFVNEIELLSQFKYLGCIHGAYHHPSLDWAHSAVTRLFHMEPFPFPRLHSLNVHCGVIRTLGGPDNVGVAPVLTVLHLSIWCDGDDPLGGCQLATLGADSSWATQIATLFPNLVSLNLESRHQSSCHAAIHLARHLTELRSVRAMVTLDEIRTNLAGASSSDIVSLELESPYQHKILEAYDTFQLAVELAYAVGQDHIELLARNFPGLTRLYAHQTRLVDLAPLTKLTQLKELMLANQMLQFNNTADKLRVDLGQQLVNHASQFVHLERVILNQIPAQAFTASGIPSRPPCTFMRALRLLPSLTAVHLHRMLFRSLGITSLLDVDAAEPSNSDALIWPRLQELHLVDVNVGTAMLYLVERLTTRTVLDPRLCRVRITGNTALLLSLAQHIALRRYFAYNIVIET